MSFRIPLSEKNVFKEDNPLSPVLYMPLNGKEGKSKLKNQEAYRRMNSMERNILFPRNSLVRASAFLSSSPRSHFLDEKKLLSNEALSSSKSDKENLPVSGKSTKSLSKRFARVLKSFTHKDGIKGGKDSNNQESVVVNDRYAAFEIDSSIDFDQLPENSKINPRNYLKMSSVADIKVKVALDLKQEVEMLKEKLSRVEEENVLTMKALGLALACSEKENERLESELSRLKEMKAKEGEPLLKKLESMEKTLQVTIQDKLKLVKENEFLRKVNERMEYEVGRKETESRMHQQRMLTRNEMAPHHQEKLFQFMEFISSEIKSLALLDRFKRRESFRMPHSPNEQELNRMITFGDEFHLEKVNVQQSSSSSFAGMDVASTQSTHCHLAKCLMEKDLELNSCRREMEEMRTELECELERMRKVRDGLSEEKAALKNEVDSWKERLEEKEEEVLMLGGKIDILKEKLRISLR